MFPSDLPAEDNGGGGGLGGAIFVMQGASLTIVGKSTLAGGSVHGGSATVGAVGRHSAAGMFLQGSGVIGFGRELARPEHVVGAIDDESASSRTATRQIAQSLMAGATPFKVRAAVGSWFVGPVTCNGAYCGRPVTKL
jgi:hypothetical protein